MLERNLQLAEPTVATPTTFKKFQNKLDTPLFIDAMLTPREHVLNVTTDNMLTKREHGTRRLLCPLDVVTPKHAEVADVEAATRDHRVGPGLGAILGAVGLIRQRKAALLV